MTDIEGDTHSNDPAHPDYSSSAPTWIGETFTFNGGASTPIEISDDDGQFEDGYVETGGAQTLAQDVTINGTTYLAGSVIENEFSMLDASGNEVFIVRIDGINIGFGYPAGQEPTNGTTFTGTTGRDGAPEDSGDGVSSSSEPYNNIVCFAEGTLILTPEGERPVECLRPGQEVLTLDRGPQRIRWTRRYLHGLEDVSTDEKPVQIAAGALGGERPKQDLVVSPQHRILVGGHRQLPGLFPTEAFAPAKSLTKLPGIRHLKSKRNITIVHFACDRHEVVSSNGCFSESLLLGPMVLKGMSASERQAVVDIFGPALTPTTALNGTPARKCLKFRTVRRQIVKSSQPQKELTAKEAGKWDVDAAMERHEAELLREVIAINHARRKRVG